MGTWIVDIRFIADWLSQQDAMTEALVLAAVERLSALGPNLKRPLVGTIRGSRHHNMKELRPASTGNSEVRILFIFDPKRRAVLLLAGDKANGARLRKAPKWNDWYRQAIPQADDLYDQYLQRCKEERI